MKASQARTLAADILYVLKAQRTKRMDSLDLMEAMGLECCDERTELVAASTAAMDALIAANRILPTAGDVILVDDGTHRSKWLPYR